MEGFIMKKNFIVKVMTLVMAATMALTPVTASAAEKKVVTAKEFGEMESSFLNREERTFDNKGWMNYVASLDGCYQENGNKIYTALNGKTITFKKTGNYSVIVGGKTAKKDEGTFKFVAPKTGTYKFTFTTKDNVAGGQIFLDWDGGKVISFKTNYTRGKQKYTHDSTALVTNDSDRCAYPTLGKGLSRYEDCRISYMTKVSGSIQLKKGQSVIYTGRACDASYDEPNSSAYNFTGFDVKITKTK